MNIEGYCPMGCGRTLFLGDGGYVTCSYQYCPRPDAVADLLRDNETQHIVEFREKGFTVRHPLRERLDDALMTCGLHRYCEELDGPPVALGVYRARRTVAGGWKWERLEGEAAS